MTTIRGRDYGQKSGLELIKFNNILFSYELGGEPVLARETEFFVK